jgi:hypothetical protein
MWDFLVPAFGRRSFTLAFGLMVWRQDGKRPTTMSLVVRVESWLRDPAIVAGTISTISKLFPIGNM